MEGDRDVRSKKGKLDDWNVEKKEVIKWKNTLQEEEPI